MLRLTAPEVIRQFPALLFADAVDSIAALHPSVRDLLDRPAMIGPAYFASTADRRSLISDLRMARLQDPLDTLTTGLTPTVLDSALDLVLSTNDRQLDHAMRSVLHHRRDIRDLPPLIPQRFAAETLRLLAESPSTLHQILACYVDSYSSWPDAQAIVAHIARRLPSLDLSDDAGQLAAACGSVLGSGGEPAYSNFYRAAAVRLTDSWDLHFLYIRWATVAIKRTGEQATAKRCFEKAGYAAGRLADSGDRAYAHAIQLNLQALEAIRQGQHQKAHDYIDAAVMHVNLSGGPRTLRPSVATRYATTIRTNACLLPGYAGDWTTSARSMTAFVDVVADADPRSLAEVLSLAGLSWVRAHDPARAIPMLEQAEELLNIEMAIRRLRMVRKVLTIANLDQGLPDRALYWLSRANST